MVKLKYDFFKWFKIYSKTYNRENIKFKNLITNNKIKFNFNNKIK